MGNNESEKPNPNRGKMFYYLNMIFLCAVTVISLTMTVILFIRLERMRSREDQEGTLYTEAQIEKMKYAARESERNRVLLDIQSSFESGKSTISMLRDLFPGDLVVMWEGRYYFYPVDRNLQMNGFASTDFAVGDNGAMEYTGEDSRVSVSRGIDVSSLNGDIDWQKVSEDRIAFAMLRIAYEDSEGNLVVDEKFQENLSGAKSSGIRTGCYVDLGEVGEENASETAAFVLEHLGLSQKEMGAPVAVRVQSQDQTGARRDHTREEWTQSVRTFCRAIKKGGYDPVIYANTASFNMLLKMNELEDFSKWIADYGDYLYFPYKFSCWQYSVKGTVNGIEGDVALDLSVTVSEEAADDSGSKEKTLDTGENGG